ncbi:MAG: prenyltransferase, partial [Adlercreutzia equolifaciens]
MGSHTKPNSGGATTPLSPRLALQLAAPHTWPAAIMPVLVTTACALANTGSLDVGMAWLLLLICILMQASVNTFNDYFDVIKGTDTAEDNVEASDSVLVYNDVNPRSALGLAIGFLVVAFLLGLYVVWKTGPVPLVIALIGAVIVVMYSGGKTPLSYLPVGEAVSGIVMGGLIPLACYQVLSGTFTFMALLWAAPTIIGVGLIMMTNNTCDIEKDIEASRRTLPVLLGREKARTLYHALMVVWVLAILA